MPVAETNRVVPKSVLRYRPIDDSAASSSSVFPVTQRQASRSRKSTTVIDDIPEWKGVTTTTKGQKESSTHGAKSPAVSGREKTARRFSQPRIHLSKPSGSKRWGFIQVHPLLYLGLGMIVMLVLVMLLSAALGWFTMTLETIRYGYPRTYQVDAYVGQETGKTPSHFIAENLRGRVLIIEFPGGDVQHARIIVGPQIAGSDADQVPVLLSFVDRNGNHLPDMLVQFGSMEVWYANEHGTFVPQ